MAFKQFRSEPLTDKEKRYLRRSKGIVLPHSAAVGPKPIDKPKERDFNAPVQIARISKRRKFSGCRMSDEARALVEQRKAAREAFFRSL